MRFNRTIALNLDGALPTEFRLFVEGANETEKGKFVFDNAAAQSVMTAYKAWGIDVPIDLEHQMMGEPGSDPTQRDARGWCKLELRPDGSLWAVDVRWTPDGARRLTEKTQRYISPCFEADAKTRRVEKMMSIAITALPATHNTPALVAASSRKDRMTSITKVKNMLAALAAGGGLDPSLVKQALDAIEKGDAAAALDILKSLVASAAGVEPDAAGDDAGAADDGAADGADSGAPTEESAAPGAAGKPPAAGDVAGDDADPAKKTEQRAMSALLCKLTGKPSLAEAVAETEVWRTSHLTLETERTKLSRDRATLEAAERRKLVSDLVVLGAEFPSTVWTDDKQTAIKPRWQKMPIEELRSHVGEQREARGVKAVIRPAGAPGAPGAGGDSKTFGLSAAELKVCAQMACEPKDFAALKAMRDGKA